MLLQNKVALITGAGQGVGQGIALALASEGAKVVVTGRTLEKLETTCELVRERGVEALPLVCDVKDAQSMKETVEQAVAHFGALNILVNNAQEVPLGTLHDLDDEKFNRGWESGPLATFRLMKLCYPHLKGDGVIINLASSAAKRWDMTGYGGYAATKEAIRSLTRAAACEWGHEGIRCNAILPHAMSPGLEWWTTNRPEEAKEFIASIPQRRIGHCEDDIGRFVAILCSDYSAYVNGQSIALDGGQAYLG
ncbi:SDR family oxidoreductase [Parahaliea sp. F7430]|uniref:SDR family oxidoreductase n=1 Tax=Sediminihaliea albiluteola TaxID=2758564 RepID=A0A7W2YIU7_9GAMM|nr:SDR family NAD(P)-dependent oxidoreductase [Sediminihaliea albiluteola]MBA6411919.1 SDR family oxidoreductase [Sediminihaliea albiluteola]